MRIWFKMVKNARILRSETITEDSDDTRTHKIFHALDEICREWDLGKPIWLDSNITEFQRRARTRFTHDNFIEEVSFDYMEMHVIEE